MNIKINIAAMLWLCAYRRLAALPHPFITSARYGKFTSNPGNRFFKKTILLTLLITGGLYATAQNNTEALYVDGNLPSLTIKNVINYKADSIKLSDFKNKLVILNFWGTYCSACISRFEEEQLLQQQFINEVQFILVSDEPADKIKNTIQKWEQQHKQSLIFPVVTEDTVLNKLVRNRYRPHFAWIDYWQRLIAQTNEYYINTPCITGMLTEMKRQKAIQEATDAGAAQTTLDKP